MKIAYSSGSFADKDKVRGIGVHTGELSKALLELLTKNKKYASKFKIVNDPNKADIIHTTDFKLFFKNSIPLFKVKGKKYVLTIHDLIPLIYPKIFKPGIKGKLMYVYNKFLVLRSIDSIITISETSKKDICRFLGVDPKKVNVIYLGSKRAHTKITNKEDLLNARKKFDLPENFIFYYGDVDYHKNISVLARACEKLDIPLVIAGKQAGEVERLDLNHPELKHLKSIDFSKIKRLGFVSDEDANLIYNLADCYVQPSFYEGFGLSVVHAFAAGCPVIAARTQCLVEIGGDACLYFDPKDVNDLIAKIRMLQKDKKLRNSLIEKGFEQLKKYSWEKCAKETLDSYEKI